MPPTGANQCEGYRILCENSGMAAFSVVILGPPPRLSRERRLAVVGSDAVTVTFLAEGEFPTRRPNLLLAPILRAEDGLHLLRSLDRLGLAATASERARGATLVGAWFPTPWLSPEPLAQFVDLALLGGEELLGRLTAILRSVDQQDHPEILRLLTTLPGFYVPSLYQSVYDANGLLVAVEPLEPTAPLPVRALVPPVMAAPLPTDLAWSQLPTAESLHARVAGGEKSLALWVGTPQAVDPGVLGKSAEALRETGIRQLHLGFWVGIPEGPEMNQALPDWIKGLRHEFISRLRQEERLPGLSLSGHCFIPRPWTNWQWAPMALVADLKAELRLLREALRHLPVLFTHDLPKWAAVEALLARGDRRVGDLLRLAHQVGWERAEVESVWNPAFYLHRPRPIAERLPWDHFDWGIDRKALERERMREK